jgi:ABC-2 type transport system ATP-binding protein
VTSHILSEIERVATRVAILLNGRLLTVQSLEQGASPRLRVRVRSTAPDAVRATLGAVPGMTAIVSEAEVADGVQDFVVEVSARSAAEAVAARLAVGGFGLLEMTETRSDLEGLFLGLTGKAAA